MLTWGSVDRAFAAIPAGQAVSLDDGRMFVAYILKHDYLSDDTGALVPSDPPVRDAGLWKHWASIANKAMLPIEICELSYVHNPDKELPLISEAITSEVGRMHAKLVAAGSDLERGKIFMGQPVQMTCRWLRMAYEFDPHAILYSVLDGRRATVSCLVATTVDCRNRFCDGLISDQEITGGDLVLSSKHVFIIDLARYGDQNGIKVTRRERAEIGSCLYQAAYLTRGVEQLWFFSFAGSELYEDRLSYQGHVPAGKNMKGTDKPVMALCTPGVPGALKAPIKKLRDYKAMMFVIGELTRLNGSMWAQADAERKQFKTFTG